MNTHNERPRFPNTLASLIGKLAKHYSASSAVDPCCEDLSLLQECSDVKDRHAIFRNPSCHREAPKHSNGITMSLGDITRMPLTKQYELVVTCLPFGVRETLNGRSRRLDLAVAERCLDLVAPNGACLMVVPQVLLTGQLYRQFRERILSHMALDAVIEIRPRDISLESAVGLALLVIRYGSQRPGGTLLAEYRTGNPDRLIAGIATGVGDFFVPAEALSTRWDRQFHDPIHNSLRRELARLQTRALGEFGDIRIGRYVARNALTERGDYLILTGRHLRQSPIPVAEGDRFVNRTEGDRVERCLVKPGDVVFSLVSPAAYVFKDTDPPAVAGHNVAVLRTRDNEYVSTYLNTPDGRKLFDQQAAMVGSSLAGLTRLSLAELREIRIPLLPLAELNSVSDAAIAKAAPLELEELRLELLRVKRKLKIAEAELEREQHPHQRMLDEMRDEIRSGFRFLQVQISKISEQQQATNAKLDQILQALASMRDGISEIKQGSRKEEEKLAQICAKLDKFADATRGEATTIQEYVAVVQTWLNRWDTLHAFTKKFLPSAEQLYDLLEKQTGADFSPFIIQYCRAFENEILTKLFCAYHEDVNGRIKDLATFLATDLAKAEKKGREEEKKSSRFAESVRKDHRKYCLGNMNFIMQLIKPGGSNLANSPLLQDFQRFVVQHFDQRVAEKEFLDRIARINEEFRNKSAHPNVMDKAAADDCSAMVRLALSELLDSYHTETIPLHGR